MRLTDDFAVAKLPAMHSQTPWRYERSPDTFGCFDIRAGNDYYIAMTIGGIVGGDTEGEANARLLSAAPALLAALREVAPDHPLVGVLTC